MTRALNIGPGMQLAPEQAEDVIAIIGRRGRGKTNTAVVFVEELHRAGARFCIADPVGVWWGLHSSKDGKAAGIPVVVMGGEHGDVPLEETAGRVIADFVADKTSPSVVLDFRGFRKAQMTRFMADFLEQLYHRNREALHLVLDEADQFAPQRVMGETARLVGAAEDVCKMGRAKGLHPIVITQRPAALNKNVLTQAGLLVAHQLTGPQDQKAVDEWIRANADEKERAEFMRTIATLERGEAWFWQPEIPVFQRVHVRARKTFDSSATPKRGEKRSQPRAAAEVDLAALKQRIASTIEKAKAEDPRELRRTIADLRAQLAKAQAVKPLPAAPAAKPKERLAVKEAHVKRLHELARRCEIAAERGDKASAALRDEARDLRAALGAVAAAGGAHSAQGAGRGTASPAVLERRPAPVVSRAPIASRSTGNGLAPAHQKILDRLAWLNSVGIEQPDRAQLALWCDLSPTSGGFFNYLGALRTAGLIAYPTPGTVALTATGREAAALPESLSIDEMQRSLFRKVGESKAKILRVLIERYPSAVDRDELAAAVGMSRTSGGYFNYLGALRSLGVVDYPSPGQVVAKPVLFLEGAT